ncbi:hypothetical protein GBF38_001310 [Nibea albiflora]|uniref:Uncharacterized protein n=1 Tax=Nibea albiflora TaxID=240163 RepID=A0ACB7EUR7_NIBAL|nr:hypothetical protein GBF38_001310 [Nibea albiflora]
MFWKNGGHLTAHAVSTATASASQMRQTNFYYAATVDGSGSKVTEEEQLENVQLDRGQQKFIRIHFRSFKSFQVGTPERFTQECFTVSETPQFVKAVTLYNPCSHRRPAVITSVKLFLTPPSPCRILINDKVVREEFVTL